MKLDLIKKDVEALNEITMNKLIKEKDVLEKIVKSINSYSVEEFTETIKRIIGLHSKLINCQKLFVKIMEKNKELNLGN